jgi:hypothetical protein
MQYLVEATASTQKGNVMDDKGDPGHIFEYIVLRFKPDAGYGNPPSDRFS